MELELEKSIFLDTALPNSDGDQENIRVEFIDKEVTISLADLSEEEITIYNNFVNTVPNKQVKIINYSQLLLMYRETNVKLGVSQLELDYNTLTTTKKNRINSFVNMAYSK